MLPVIRAKVAHFTDQGFRLHGVVHVGTAEGEEIPWYLHMGHVPVLGFEPNVSFHLARQEFARNPDVSLHNCALGERDGVLMLHVDKRVLGKGTSAYMPVPHPDHPWSSQDIFGGDITVPVYRFDTFVSQHGLDLTPYDCLVVDVQGMELEVLRGFGSCLDGFNFLNVECSERPLFTGEAPAQEVVDFLAGRGFRQDSPIFSHDDVMFVREGS